MTILSLFTQRAGILLPRNLKRFLGKAIETFLWKRLIDRAYLLRDDLKPGPVLLSGFIGEVLGIGRGADSTLKGLKAMGLSPILQSIRPIFTQLPLFKQDLPTHEEGGVWIIHCNAPEAKALILRIHEESWKHKYRIGYWAYELPKVPDEWIEVSKLFHEIWVPSQFVADALDGAHCEVKVIPHYIERTYVDREKTVKLYSNLEIPIEKRIVTALGDMRSSSARKNLAGAVDIYKDAIPAENDEFILLIKITQSDFDPISRHALENLTSDRKDIYILDCELNEEDMDTFIAGWSLLLSPHRSEGFGFTPVEALSKGIPVLATGWSGNMEYMHDLIPFLIDYKLISVVDDANVYKCSYEQHWAEPSRDDAVNKFRTILHGHINLHHWLNKAQENVDHMNEKWTIEYTHFPYHFVINQLSSIK